MVRRHIAKEPTSRLAVWARRCALFSLVATLLVIVIVRAGLIELDPSLAALTAALGFAGIAIVLAVAGMVVIWREGLAGLGHSLLAFVIGAGLLAYPAYTGVKYLRTPELNDVTTDMSDPLCFVRAGRPRPSGTTSCAGVDAVVAARQHANYSDIEPLQISATPQVAYEAAMSVISKRKWNVIYAQSPQVGRRDGQIEAVVRTPILGFREDVVVRVRRGPDGARVDVRSASRSGRHDLGSNAARVKSLLEDIEDQVAVVVEEQKKRVAKPAPAKPPAQPARR